METIFQYSQTGPAIILPVSGNQAQSPGMGGYTLRSIVIDNGTAATLYLAQQHAGATKNGAFATVRPYTNRSYPVPNWLSFVIAGDGTPLVATDTLTIHAYDASTPPGSSANASTVTGVTFTSALIDAVNVNGAQSSASFSAMYGTSGYGILAADRPIDSWFQQNGVVGAAASATQSAPGAGLQLICSTISAFLMSGGIGDAVVVKLQDGAGNIVFQSELGVSVTAFSTDRLEPTDLRLPAAAAKTFVLSTTAPAQAGTVVRVNMSGYTVQLVNA